MILPSNTKLIDGSNIIDGEVILDRIIEKNLTSSIEIRNLPSGFSAKLDRESLSMVISGGKTSVSGLKAESIKCYINLGELDEGEYTIPIGIELPQNVTLVSQGTKFVKVSIVKSDSKSTNAEDGKNSGEVSDKNTTNTGANN
ncbi:hypothetical protein GOM49_16245 [Clostridium bovifaecis]|uniref:Uncharacterized protein n=1 Tax=Clostridium bovifaecis TaxID=2184719 RepID=A0A6I6ERQ8_9CLOT|nr:hypothetical protein GOM49_16245 [Clostridium bovifaecis]